MLRDNPYLFLELANKADKLKIPYDKNIKTILELKNLIFNVEERNKEKHLRKNLLRKISLS